MQVYTYTYTNMYVCMYVCIYIYVCTYIHTYVRTYVHTYTRTGKHEQTLLVNTPVPTLDAKSKNMQSMQASCHRRTPAAALSALTSLV